MIAIYCINTGSDGSDDRAIRAAVASHADLLWAATPFEADVLLLTGPLTPPCHAPLRALLQVVSDKPLLAVGRSAQDGHPYGAGGVAVLPDIHVQHYVAGNPPEPAAIAEAVRGVLSLPISARAPALAAPPPDESGERQRTTPET
jgi:Ni,Fe-hydrogenase III small subunit